MERISRVQDYLGRKLLVENPSSYLEYQQSTFSEHAFLAEVSRRSGCGILLNVNNVFVSCRNHGWNTFEYLRGIPGKQVMEIHLAGHTVNQVSDRDILIDTHNQPVCAQVWQLYQTALRLIGPRPTLLEWDTDLPSLQTLVEEAGKADAFLEVSYERAA